MVTFVDGFIHFVTDSIQLDTFKALATIAGGEVTDADAFN